MLMNILINLLMRGTSPVPLSVLEGNNHHQRLGRNLKKEDSYHSSPILSLSLPLYPLGTYRCFRHSKGCGLSCNSIWRMNWDPNTLKKLK